MAKPATEVWREFVDLASKYAKGALSLGPEALAEKYEEYLQSLPEPARNGSIIIMGEKRHVIKRRDVPRLLREDPEFRKLFLSAFGR